MGDGNFDIRVGHRIGVSVQIPLWAMVTPLRVPGLELLNMFRFLYGRW